jgi:hypothetical protein
MPKRFSFYNFRWLRKDELEKRINDRIQYKLPLQAIIEEIDKAIEYLFDIRSQLEELIKKGN